MTVKTERRLRRQERRINHLHEADFKTQKPWPTRSNRCVKLIWTGRRFAPAWKLVTITDAFVPPEAMASQAQELDEIVDALLPLFAGQRFNQTDAPVQNVWRI